MNHHPACACAALTRIELIVSIGVFGALLAAMAPAVEGQKGVTKEAKTTATVKNIVNASRAYLNEYGKFPPIPAAEDAVGPGKANSFLSFGDTTEGKCKVDNNELFNVLRAISAKSNADHRLNKRQVRYFEAEKVTDLARPRDGFTDGQDFPEEFRGRLLDPWGVQYCVILDTDGDETLDLSPFYKDLAKPMAKAAAAFSMGPDGKRGGKDFGGFLHRPNSDILADDILSW